MNQKIRHKKYLTGGFIAYAIPVMIAMTSYCIPYIFWLYLTGIKSTLTLFICVIISIFAYLSATNFISRRILPQEQPLSSLDEMFTRKKTDRSHKWPWSYLREGIDHQYYPLSMIGLLCVYIIVIVPILISITIFV